MKKIIWILLIVAVIFGVWLFVKEPVQAPETDSMEQEIAEHAPEGTTNADEPRQSTADDMTPPVGGTVSLDAGVSTGVVKELTVEGSNFKFAPATMTVKKGDTVKLTFINSGGKHDWRIDEFQAATKVINGGERETITFVADKAGTFEYYCSVGTHRQMGMKGTLTVTE